MAAAAAAAATAAAAAAAATGNDAGRFGANDATLGSAVEPAPTAQDGGGSGVGDEDEGEGDGDGDAAAANTRQADQQPTMMMFCKVLAPEDRFEALERDLAASATDVERTAHRIYMGSTAVCFFFFFFFFFRTLYPFL